MPQVPNFEDLVRAWDDPTLRYDMDQVKVINTLNNALLLSVDLSPYPALKDRFEAGDGGITNEEYADFIYQSGTNPNTITDLFYDDFPVQFNFNELSDLLNGAADNTVVGGGDVGVTPEEAENNPIINTGSDDIAIDFTPIDRFVPGIGYTDLTDWTPGPSLVDYLNKLDFYYADSYSAIINSDICKSFSNPFAKISSLIAAAAGLAGGLSSIIDKVKSVIDKIKNFSIGALISDLAGKLQGLIDGVLDNITGLKDKMLSKLASIQSTVADFLSGGTAGGQRLYEFFNRKVQQVKEFLSEDNINALKDKVKNIMDMNKDQFEDLLPTVVNLLGLKACGISKFVDFLMQEPINRIKDTMDRTTLTQSTQEAKSIIVTNQALRAGAVRVNPNRRRVQSRSHGSSANAGRNGGGTGSSSAITPTSYVTLPMSDEERDYVQSITKDGTAEFIFSESVKSMGTTCVNTYNSGGCGNAAHADQWDPAQNYPDAGWKMIVEKNPFMFAGLKRVSERLKADGELSAPLLLNSCYRSPYYNRVVLRTCRGNSGAAWNSKHMSAMAMDISTNNMSNFGTAKLIKYLSQEGFNRISVYNSFVHVDIQDGSYRGDWTANYRGNADIRRAMELHKTRQHTEGNR